MILLIISGVFVKKNFNSGFPWFLFPLTFLFFITGVFLCLEAVQKIETGWQHKNWPTVSGMVTDVHIAGIRAFHPEIRYRYEVEGKPYSAQTDLNTPGFGNRRYRQSTAEQILADYPIGTMVQVHYDPDHPAISLLRPGPFWSDYLQLSLGLTFLALGVISLLITFKNRRGT